MIKRSAANQFFAIAISCLTLIVGVSDVFASEQLHSSDQATGAQTWSTSSQGVFFSLTQILPEQAQAFYSSRGFKLEEIRDYTESCVFMTVLRNDSAASAIYYVRDNWSVTVSEQPHRFKKVSEWLDQLKARSIKKPALIAFQWAQFPPEQEYQPGGDWNQGMLALGLPPGESFNITAHWTMQGKPYSASLKEVQCAR